MIVDVLFLFPFNLNRDHLELDLRFFFTSIDSTQNNTAADDEEKESYSSKQYTHNDRSA